jgi:hypothetical protein
MAVAPPIGLKVIAAVAKTKPAHLRLLHQEGACTGRVLKNLKITMSLHCYSTNSSTKENGDGDAESLLSLTPFMTPVVSFVSVISL